MKKQWLITLLLLVAALNLYLLVHIEQKQSSEQSPQETLTSLDPDQITSIRIDRQTESLVFIKDGNHWHMSMPLQGRANEERITELRALAVITPLAQYDVQSIDLERYGLTTPRLSVRLNDIRILFGDLNPANQRRYVLTENHLFLIADNIFPILQLPPEAFIE
jgi:hypothetical protein